MILMKPHAMLLDLGNMSIIQQIEDAGRICYRSHDKRGPGTAIDFLAHAIDRKHWSVLEMAPIHVVVETWLGKRVPQEFEVIETELAISSISHGHLHPSRWMGIDKLIVSGSLRSFRETWQTTQHSEHLSVNWSCLTARMLLAASYAVSDCDLALKGLPKKLVVHQAENPVVGRWNCVARCLSDEEAAKLDELAAERGTMLQNVFASADFFVSRAVSHELVRHRPIQVLQESQRYVRMSKDVEFVRPCFFEEGSEAWQAWHQAMSMAESSYHALLNHGCSPQQARMVLPNSCSTRLRIMADLKQWKHMFDLRCSPGADPGMREVMIPLRDKMNLRWPAAFSSDVSPEFKDAADAFDAIKAFFMNSRASS